jgi:hypothetical protein
MPERNPASTGVIMHDDLPPPRDFDAWSALARSDPQAFEVCRERVIDEAIRRAPAHRQQRLRRMQWKLNQIRNTSRTPMIACLRMHRLMWQAVIGETGLLECLNRPDAIRRSRDRAARVVPFARFDGALAVRRPVK